MGERIMCGELPNFYHQYKYNQRQEAALRLHYEYDYAKRMAKKERYRQVIGELGHALKWVVETGVKIARFGRPRHAASG